jgi:hypothetical protein
MAAHVTFSKGKGKRKRKREEQAQRDKKRRGTYSKWPPKKGTFHYVRVVDGVEKSVIMMIQRAQPLEAVEVVPAPAGGRPWVRSSVHLLCMEHGLIPAFTCR